MAKTVKLLESELQRVKDGQERVTQLIYAIGNVEIQKDRLKEELAEVQKEQNDLGTELFDKYGKGNISLETGEITLETDEDAPEVEEEATESTE